MKTSQIFLILFVALFALPFATATCTTSAQSDGTDYFGVNTATVNTTAMAGSSGALGTNELFGHYTFFTPRLNFTVPVNDTFTLGGVVGACADTGWSSWLNISSSLVLKNGTNVISPTNYTFAWLNQSAGQWCVNFTQDWSATSNITVFFNRTFVKNVDDLVVCPACIRTGPGGFLTLNTPAAYGDDATFKLNTGYGKFINNQNWAVGWDYTEQTCTSTVNCTAGVNNTLFYFLAGMFMIGMIVFIVFAFKDGVPDMKSIVYTVVAFLIMLVGLAIINGLVKAVCLP